jgi:hypothetical protein
MKIILTMLLKYLDVRKLSLTVVALAFVMPVGATDNLKFSETSLTQASNKFADAMNRKDFDRIASQTNLKIVEATGGKSALAKQLQAMLSELLFSNFHFNLKEKSCAAIAKSVACVLPYSANLLLNGEAYLFDSFYIASGDAQGQNWYFSDGNGAYKPGALKFLFPEYEDQLRLPVKTKPRKLGSNLN